MSAFDPHRSDWSAVLFWTVIVPGLIGLAIAFIVFRAWQRPESNNGAAAPGPAALQLAQQDLRDGHRKEAAQLFAVLAKRGDANAQYWLGRLAEKGIGAGRDIGKAIDLYKRAADRNDVAAEVRLGEIYLRGNLALPDSALAQRYLERAADQGSPSAAMLMGELYRGAVGRTPDLVEAYAWSEVATVEGSRFAVADRDAALHALDPQGQQAALARARDILAGIRGHAPPR
ncbi:MAG TPA: tetratricopeptide repeat protein [Xanthobacteraceae bacterium]|nr:tetratricopeptide repeat protein [Xanthobacteraceae bacterium]